MQDCDKVELWAKKEGQHVKSPVYCETGPVLFKGGSASFLKTGVENSPDFAIVALRVLSFLWEGTILLPHFLALLA